MLVRDFTWLKAFEFAKIESTFRDEGGFHTRSFRFDENYDEDGRGLPKPAVRNAVGTTVELVDLKRNYVDQCPKSADSFIQKLIEHFISVIMLTTVGQASTSGIPKTPSCWSCP